MDFEDEDYVRLYIRDTPTWKALGWEGQTVFCLTMRKVGRRTGVLETEGFSPEEAIASVTDLPLDIATRGLAALVKREVAIVESGRIVLPKFLKAQWARRGDAARKRDSRDAQAAEESVTAKASVPRKSRSVTRGHTRSQASRNVPSQSHPSQSNPIPDQDPDLALAAEAARAEPSEHQRLVDLYFSEFERSRGAKPAFDGKDGKAVQKLLNQLGFDAACGAVRCAYRDPFWCRQATISSIAKDPSRFLGEPTATGPPRRVPDAVPGLLARIERMKSEEKVSAQ